ncbi:MAG: RNA pyrophosphohydrolase [Proteobacteria bacterium]|nr:RNA pyrophosphohydrolase [Pseudomonadota bacterium]
MSHAPIIRARMPFRPCVGAALFNARGEVFIGRRTGGQGAEYNDQAREWQMPQGGIDGNEPAYDAARRELYEETNVRSVVLLGTAPFWFHYELPDAVLGKALHGKYRGQTQKWFAFRFTGEDREIDVANPANGAHPAEFVEWRWEPLENLPGLIVPFKRPVYEQIVAAFAPYAIANAAHAM